MCKIFMLMVVVGGVVSGGWAQFWPPGFDIPLYILVPDGQTPNKVDFEDFIAFAQAFDSKQGDPNYNALADTNSDGVVNFPDFIAFAGVYGLEQVPSVGTTPASPPLYSISGRALLDSIGLAGVRVYLNNNQRFHTETDGSGYFNVDRLEAGTYKIHLSKPGFVVTPDTLQIEITDVNITEIDFTVRALRYLISGTVVDSASGIGLAGVQMSVQGDSTYQVVTDTLGYFALGGLSFHRHYYLEPWKEGYIFTPQSTSIEFSGRDTVAVQDFEARPLTVSELEQTVALELDLLPGYQGVHKKMASEEDESLVLDVVVLGGAVGVNGFSFVLEYDEDLLRWRGFERKDLFSRAVVISSTTDSESVVDGIKRIKTSVSMVILRGAEILDAGSVGYATFDVLKPISKTHISLSDARFGYLEQMPNFVIPLMPEKVMVSLGVE